jgi:hypothetical protein
MPPQDEIAIDQEAPPQEQPQTGRSGYHGRTGTLPDGRRVVWQEPANGRGGRFVALSAATADAASRAQLKAEQDRFATMRDTSRMVEDFIDHNRRQGTGGLGQAPWVPAIGAPHRQAMQGLSSSILRENIRPGMSGTLNSDAEQQIAQRAFPNEGVDGDITAEYAVRWLTSRDVQYELVNQMEQWLSQRPSLDGFQQHWRQMEPELRENIRRMHVRRFGSRNYGFPDLNDRGIYDPQAPDIPQRPGGFNPNPANGVIRYERDPTTGEVRRVQ